MEGEDIGISEWQVYFRWETDADGEKLWYQGPKNEFEMHDLTQGLKYGFKIRGRIGKSEEWSPYAYKEVSPCMLPSAPRNLVVKYHNVSTSNGFSYAGGVHFKWDPPELSPGCAVDRYLIFGMHTDMPVEFRHKYFYDRGYRGNFFGSHQDYDTRHDKYIHWREFLGFTTFNEFFYQNEVRVRVGTTWEFAVFAENQAVRQENPMLLPHLPIYHHHPDKFAPSYAAETDYYAFPHPEELVENRTFPHRKTIMPTMGDHEVYGEHVGITLNPIPVDMEPTNAGLNPFTWRWGLGKFDGVQPAYLTKGNLESPSCAANPVKRCGVAFIWSHYSEGVAYEGDRAYWLVQANGIPNHVMNEEREAKMPFEVCEQWMQLYLPLEPKRNTDDLGNHFFRDASEAPHGVMGIAKTGALIHSHLSNFDGENDIAMRPENEGLTVDSCNGHSDYNCHYHYHSISRKHACSPKCVFEECAIIGWMVDGFPMYSQCAGLRSCYHMRNSSDDGVIGDDSADWFFRNSFADACELDEANGYDFTGSGIKDNNGNEIVGYAYVASDVMFGTPPKLAGAVQPFRYNIDYTEAIPLNNPSKCGAPTHEPHSVTLGGATVSRDIFFAGTASGSKATGTLSRGSVPVGKYSGFLEGSDYLHDDDELRPFMEPESYAHYEDGVKLEIQFNNRYVWGAPANGSITIAEHPTSPLNLRRIYAPDPYVTEFCTSDNWVNYIPAGYNSSDANDTSFSYDRVSANSLRGGLIAIEWEPPRYSGMVPIDGYTVQVNLGGSRGNEIFVFANHSGVSQIFDDARIDGLNIVKKLRTCIHSLDADFDNVVGGGRLYGVRVAAFNKLQRRENNVMAFERHDRRDPHYSWRNDKYPSSFLDAGKLSWSETKYYLAEAEEARPPAPIDVRIVQRTKTAVILSFDLPSGVPDWSDLFANDTNATNATESFNSTNSTNETAYYDPLQYSYFVRQARDYQRFEMPLKYDYRVSSLNYFQEVSRKWPLPPIVLNDTNNSCLIWNDTDGSSTWGVLLMNNGTENCTFITEANETVVVEPYSNATLNGTLDVNETEPSYLSPFYALCDYATRCYFNVYDDSALDDDINYIPGTDDWVVRTPAYRR